MEADKKIEENRLYSHKKDVDESDGRKIEMKTKKAAKRRSVKKMKEVEKEKKKEGKREFQCDHCDYKATQKINLVRHLGVHTGQRFSCADCGKIYR